MDRCFGNDLLDINYWNLCCLIDLNAFQDLVTSIQDPEHTEEDVTLEPLPRAAGTST